MEPQEYISGSLSNKKKTIITLQWVVVIGTAYLVLFSEGHLATSLWAYCTVLALLTSMMALLHFPDATFNHRFFPHALVLTDTILVSAGILSNKESPWDLFLVFFFGLFIAGIGENLIKIILGCLIISVVSILISRSWSDGAYLLSSNTLLRVPFIFGVSLLYGYLADQVRKEKSRAERVEETEKVKRQMVSALAHDIKNPLTSIVGYADLLAARHEGISGNSEDLEFLKSINNNARLIVRLVTSFLDASSVEARQIEVVKEPVDLNRLIRAVVEQQSGNTRQKNLSLNLDIEDNLPLITGDESKLDRVLWNLLGNAVKFTPAGGMITVTSRTNKGQVCVSVKDTGLGIPEEELPHLFTEFQRLKSAANIEGTGLGLFIVKTIMESHGGTVRIESKQGYGSTFTIAFPLRPHT